MRSKMRDITKEFNGDGSRVKIEFPCTKLGCGGKVEETFDKPPKGYPDVSASCNACGASYEITVQPYEGCVSGTVTI
jgi:hypothetical protein